MNTVQLTQYGSNYVELQASGEPVFRGVTWAYDPAARALKAIKPPADLAAIVRDPVGHGYLHKDSWRLREFRAAVCYQHSSKTADGDHKSWQPPGKFLVELVRDGEEVHYVFLPDIMALASFGDVTSNW